MNGDIQLDAGEAGCSEPITLIFQTMKRMGPGQSLEVLAHDQMTDIDISAWCRMTGNVLVAQSREKHPQRNFHQWRAGRGIISSGLGSLSY
ncbi:MAG: sulfurtransferase TusA [Chloroflexi bacterium]|nr:sulfurtransferase TusA [Chloroflexota bacterium]